MAASLLGELSCAVCLDTYTDPVTLPCMHSYCRQCLWGISKNKNADDSHCNRRKRKTSKAQNERVIDCPECRYIAVLDERGIDGLPKNFTLAKLVERCKSSRENEIPRVPCSVCDVDPPRPAVKSCIQCSLSYCTECIQLHPNRGALAKHNITEIQASPQRQPSVADLTDQESTNAFCLSCNKIINTSASNSHDGPDHETIGLKEARLQKWTLLEKSLVQLEKNKRDVGRSIFDSQTSLEQIQVAEKRQGIELTQTMERMRELLNSKESELKRQIKTEAMGVTQSVETNMDDNRHVMAELSGIIQSGQNLLEEKIDDSLFIERAVAVENRISAMKTDGDYKKATNSETLSDGIYVEIKNMEKALQSALENKHYSDKSLQDQGKTPPLVRKVKLSCVRTASSKLEEDGSLYVNWGFMSGRKFDLKLSCPNGEDQSETMVISKITSNHYTADRLRCDTLYQVSVSLHGQPETESDVMTCRTSKSKKMDSKADAKNAKKVELISVEPGWHIRNGVLVVKWLEHESHSWKTVYDVKVERSAGDDKVKTFMISCSTKTYMKLKFLDFEKEYDVSVMVHGCPETESMIKRAKTLPRIVNSDFIMDVTVSSDDVDISPDATDMMHTDDSTISQDMYENISGTTSSHVFTDLAYWEVIATFFMGNLSTGGDTAFEIGICDCGKVDKVSEVKKNHFSYVCCAVRRGNSALLEYYREGKSTGIATPLIWKKPFNVHLGFFVNMRRREFSLINVETEKLLITFNGIKKNYTCVAVFHTGDSRGRTKLKMTLLSGRKITSIPEVVYKNLL